MAIMGGLMLGGMVFQAGYEGATQDKNIDEIEQQISAIKNQTANLQAKYAALDKSNAELLAQLIQDVTTYQNEYNNTVTLLQLKRDDFNKSQTTAKYIGIAFVSTVFFILLLKLFWPKGGMFHLFEEAAGVDVKPSNNEN